MPAGSGLARVHRPVHAPWPCCCRCPCPRPWSDVRSCPATPPPSPQLDAGADFVVTQLFYDCDRYLQYVKDCR